MGQHLQCKVAMFWVLSFLCRGYEPSSHVDIFYAQ